MKTLKLSIILAIIFVVFGFLLVGEVQAGLEHNVSGWAWMDPDTLIGGDPVGTNLDLGWISFNRTNCDANNDGLSDGTPVGCPTAGTAIPNYGVHIDPATGNFSGYAWAGGGVNADGSLAPTIGWIRFNPPPDFNTGNYPNCPASTCPTGPPNYPARLDSVSKKITGWARACAGLNDDGDGVPNNCQGPTRTDGWDGWILLGPIVKGGTDYGVWINDSVSPAEFRGWAWGSDVVGWISFNGVITTFSFNNPPNAAISCEIVDCKGPGCECNGTWTTFNGDGVIYRINNDSTDPDDNIVKSTWSIVGYQDPYFSCSSPDPLCNLTLPKIPRGDYTIKLTVEDEGGLSDTTSHPIKVKQDPIADFDCSLNGEDWEACEGLVVYRDQLIYLKCKSTASDGAVITSRTWKINNVVFNSGNNATTSVNLAESENTITLVIADSQGRSDSEDKTIEARLPLPEYKEVPPVIWLKNFFAGIVNFFNGFLKPTNG